MSINRLLRMWLRHTAEAERSAVCPSWMKEFCTVVEAETEDCCEGKRWEKIRRWLGEEEEAACLSSAERSGARPPWRPVGHAQLGAGRSQRLVRDQPQSWSPRS